MASFVAVDEIRTAHEPAILLKAREESAQRLMMAYAITGLFFMLLPGTFLGVWNLISISDGHASAISTAWIQAHGHAQIFGWIGTFILGIGFYSISKMTGGRVQPSSRGWLAWGLWSSGVLLRWACGFYHLYWRVLLPLSALLELAGFLIFLNSIRRHRAAASRISNEHMPFWILSVLVGTAGFGMALLLNLLVAMYMSLYDNGPAFPLIGVRDRPESIARSIQPIFSSSRQASISRGLKRTRMPAKVVETKPTVSA